MDAITAEMLIREVVRSHPATARVFAHHGMPCAGCQIAAAETVAQGAAAHGIAPALLLEELNRVAAGGEAPATTRTRPPGKLAREGIRRVVAVMSGKGGVGKSLVTGLCALTTRRAGRQVGILDGDITGPSIPRMFGLQDARRGELPAVSRSGIRIASMNLLLESEEQPVIWRGPLVSGALRQFFTDLEWGELDYLWVDLPPGTSDAPLTALQALPLDGVVMVATPQALAGMVVKKAIRLVQELGVPILGVVENMSYLPLPDGTILEPFGPSTARELVLASGAPLLARVPLDQRIAGLCDTGRIEEYRSPAAEELAVNLGSVLEEDLQEVEKDG
ncbi:MAG: P-loop NTPase [Thermaerobacter sp.]|nr:P-loop NTPase [Thermaerobacter sp.]